MKFINYKSNVVLGIICFLFIIGIVLSTYNSKKAFSSYKSISKALAKYTNNFELLKSLILKEGGLVNNVRLNLSDEKDKVLVSDRKIPVSYD